MHRRGSEVSQRELADLFGMEQASLSRAEAQGKAIPPRRAVIRAAQLLRLDDPEREELLVLAGYAPTVRILELLLAYMRDENVEEQRNQLTRREVEQVLIKCLAAMNSHGELVAADTNGSEGIVEKEVIEAAS